MITEAEAAHAMALLREVSGTGWTGRRSVVPIDPVCRWHADGEPPCGRELWAAFVLENSEAAHVLVLCEHHAKIMEAAIERWRGLS